MNCVALNVVLQMCCFAIMPRSALAGGSSESVFLVFNASDPNSVTIANHYQRLRSVPSSNLFGIDWKGSKKRISVHKFRTAILEPLLKEIDRRGLSQQIDHVVYSSGFPYAISFKGDLPAKEKRPYLVASITSLTFFYQQVVDRQVGYRSLSANEFANVKLDRSSTVAFSSQSSWSRGRVVPKGGAGGERYLLATMLGFTDGRGNTVAEIVEYLSSARAADGSRPMGDVYFMKSSDIRSRTRAAQFAPVVAKLNQLGISASVESGALPQGKTRVVGLTTGAANLNWADSRSKFVPGAFCDNLTSYGGVMAAGASQTPISDFLRHGAAGASGTVVEPYAIASKFPHAVFHLHYARGCCLAEAFYRSTQSPFQILLIGDPLCQPWATSASFEVAVNKQTDSNGLVVGQVEFEPASTAHDLLYFLYANGRQVASSKPGQKLRFDTARLPDGYHEFRVVARSSGPIAECGVKSIPIVVGNHGNTIESQIVKQGRDVVINVNATNADGVQAWSKRRLVGICTGGSGLLSIDRTLIGDGPAQIQLIAVSSAAKTAVSFGIPIELNSQLRVRTPLSDHHGAMGISTIRAGDSND